MVGGKFGIGVVSYNRFDFVISCLESIFDSGSLNSLLDFDLILLQDGTDYSVEQNDRLTELVGVGNYFTQPNSGVGLSKNFLVRELLRRGCEHIFLVEDDMLILSPDTFSGYVSYADSVGVRHLNFGLHGPANRFPDGSSRRVFSGGLSFFPHCVGSFSYYHRSVFWVSGFFDECFVNAWEHVEHTYRISMTSFHPPFWFFVDHPRSEELVGEQLGSIDSSSIRPRSDWNVNIVAGRDYWIKKWGEWLPPTPEGWNG